MNVVTPRATRALHRLSLGVSKGQLAAAAKEAQSSDRSVIRVLVALGLVREDDLLQQLASLLGMRFLSLEPADVSPAAVSRVPAQVVEHYGVMPVCDEGGVLEVAVPNPFDHEVLDDLAVVVGASVRPALATADSISRAVRHHYGVGAETIERLTASSVICSFTSPRVPTKAAGTIKRVSCAIPARSHSASSSNRLFRSLREKRRTTSPGSRSRARSRTRSAREHAMQPGCSK